MDLDRHDFELNELIERIKGHDHRLIALQIPEGLKMQALEMMDEIERVHKSVKPSETLFVVDSMTGQDAVNTAKAFNDRLDFDGVVLTKLDGDTRGGAALSRHHCSTTR